MPFDRRACALERAKERILLGKDALDGGGAKDLKGLKLAEVEKADDEIRVGIWKEDAVNRSAAGFFGRREFGTLSELLAKVRGCAGEEPNARGRGNRELRLRASTARKCAAAQAATIRAAAIPLRETAPGGRAEDFDTHLEVRVLRSRTN